MYAYMDKKKRRKDLLKQIFKESMGRSAFQARPQNVLLDMSCFHFRYVCSQFLA